MYRSQKHVGLVLLSAALCSLITGCSANNEPLGENPSIEIYPIMLVDEPSVKVSEVMALMLEQKGMERIDVNSNPFTPNVDQSFDEQAREFADFVSQQSMETDYALYAAYLGSPDTGVDEVRGFMADGEGQIVWSEQQTKDDAEFKRSNPTNPMSCCVFLVDQLDEPLNLGSGSESSSEGKWVKHWRTSSLAPSDDEIALMEAREEVLSQSVPDVTIHVYPVRVDQQEKQWDPRSAIELAALLNEKGMANATAVETPIEFTYEPDSNEQKVLWSAARTIRELVGEQQPKADYVLFAHFMLSPRDGKVRAVHMFLVEPDGDWVLTEFQNSHHPEFQAISPDSVSHCCDLVLVLLEEGMR